MIALNTQPKEGLDRRADGSLEVVGEPWLTIQGEGPFAGRPAVFVRLAGCNLDCPTCDTDYTRQRHYLTAPHLVEKIEGLPATRWHNPLVVLTGGEPLRQNLKPFVKALVPQGYLVQIETNGTLFDERLFAEGGFGSDLDVTVVCSPKAPKVHPGLLSHIAAYKYVLDADHVDPEDGLPSDVLGTGVAPARCHPNYSGPVFLQPADHQDPIINQRNLDAAVQSCLKYGYRLSVQIHKIIGLP